jgi:error-prone DNA polymerase
VTAFAELGARSHFSLLDGASSPCGLVATAKVYGHAGLGICDTHSLAGMVRGHVAAKEIGLPRAVEELSPLAAAASHGASPPQQWRRR